MEGLGDDPALQRGHGRFKGEGEVLATDIVAVAVSHPLVLDVGLESDRTVIGPLASHVEPRTLPRPRLEPPPGSLRLRPPFDTHPKDEEEMVLGPLAAVAAEHVLVRAVVAEELDRAGGEVGPKDWEDLGLERVSLTGRRMRRGVGGGGGVGDGEEEGDHSVMYARC